MISTIAGLIGIFAGFFELYLFIDGLRTKKVGFWSLSFRKDFFVFSLREKPKSYIFGLVLRFVFALAFFFLGFSLLFSV